MPAWTLVANSVRSQAATGRPHNSKSQFIFPYQPVSVFFFSFVMTYLNFTFQDSSPLISYSLGQWNEGSSINDTNTVYYSEESFKVTSDADATATLTFVGTSITLYGAKRYNHGNYWVVLDDGPTFMGVGLAERLFQFPLWNAQDLSNSQHTAVLTKVPTPNLTYLDVDFVSIGREIKPPDYNGPIFDVTIDDESPFVVYNSSEFWTPVFSSTASSSTLHQTTEEGASLSLFFQASSVELYGLYVNAPFQVILDNQLPRDLAGPDVGLENTIYEHPQTLLYYADGLDENQTHVVVLTNTVGDSTRPLYFDFAIVRSSQSFFGDTPGPNQGFSVPTSTPTVTTSASSNTYAPSAQSHSIPLGAIIGGAVGGIAGLAILAVIGFIFRCSRYRHPASPRLGSTSEGSSVGSLHRITPLVRSSQTQNLPCFGPSSPSPDALTARTLQTGLASTGTTSENCLAPPPDPPQELSDSTGSLVQTSLPPPYNPDWDRE